MSDTIDMLTCGISTLTDVDQSLAILKREWDGLGDRADPETLRHRTQIMARLAEVRKWQAAINAGIFRK